MTKWPASKRLCRLPVCHMLAHRFARSSTRAAYGSDVLKMPKTAYAFIIMCSRLCLSFSPLQFVRLVLSIFTHWCYRKWHPVCAACMRAKILNQSSQDVRGQVGLRSDSEVHRTSCPGARWSLRVWYCLLHCVFIFPSYFSPTIIVLTTEYDQTL